jgi:hypothetical protein
MPEFRALSIFATTTLFALLGAACGSKGAVSLTARIESSELGVTSGTLASGLSGQFDLVLELGEHAPRATTVSAPSFGVRQGNDMVVPTLSLSASERFPIELEPGSDQRVRFTVAENESVTDEEAEKLCAGPIRISGTVTDSLNDGKPAAIDSPAFQVDCP